MQQDDDYAQLERLIEGDDFRSGEEYCLEQLARGQDQHFWRTQLGYVNFLNERDAFAQYNRAPEIFETLATDYPDDENAHFWYGYIPCVLMGQDDLARRELTTVLSLTPDHAYANLVLAELLSPIDRINHLKQDLRTQPTNFRVLQRLAELYAGEGQAQDALNMLKIMIGNDPYFEHQYGIMNSYMNGVLTGALHEKNWRIEAKEMAESLSRQL